jgi:preprotein translocase subunit SecD
MDRNWLYKLGVVIGAVMLALWFLGPTLIYFQMSPEDRGDQDKFAEAVPDWMTERHLTLGLDLQGGIHLVMGVEVDKALIDRVQRRGDEILRFAEERSVPVSGVRAERERPELNVEVPAEARDQFERVVMDHFQDMAITGRNADGFVVAFTAEDMTRIQDQAVDQAVKTIRNRVDAWGVTEPQIARRGDTSVLIQLPGVSDPERAKDLLGQTAQLEFRITEDHQTGFLRQHSELYPPAVSLESERGAGPGGSDVTAWYLQADDRRFLEAARQALVEADALPEGTILAFERVQRGQEQYYRTYLLRDRAGITGDYLTDARVSLDQQRGGRPYVALEFDREGARVFEELTAENTQRRMAIVLDDTVNSAPVIQERIGGGRASITLGSLEGYDVMLREANDLALVLRAGALPAPVRILEERTVGATLGPDLISRGVTALAVGGLLVLLFMVVYYRGAGLVANLTLVMVLTFLLAILAGFGATLTLPGLAGIVLTVGMAVDANVIIFERIREEMSQGRSARAAIDAGYSKAFSAIVDGNVTTAIAAFVLLQYGTGPIRGFAVTLLAGIAATLFACVFASRVFMEAMHSGKAKKVSVGGA